MLGDTTPLEEWADRDDPPLSVWRTVNTWVAGLDNNPAQFPSFPVEELCDLPRYQIRQANVPDCSVVIYYRENYSTGVVDLLGVIST